MIDTFQTPGRVNVIGSRISDCDCDAALRLLGQAALLGHGGYVCFTNVHTVVLGHDDPIVRSITNGSLLSLADGKPVFWVGRAKGARAIGHVPGPDFFIEALRRYPQDGHFFYGSSPEVLSRLTSALHQMIPDVKICGSISPPFRPLTDDERQLHYRIIRNSGAAFVWIGLGAPKQERWMADAWQYIRPCIALGVGAAFDFYAGTVQRAPRRIGRMGLEWLYRLLQEPRRLWKRYLVTNSLFIYYLISEHLRKFPRQADPRRPGSSGS